MTSQPKPNAPTRDSEVTLREISEQTVRAVCAVETHDKQRQFVAPVAFSLAQALFSDRAWFRAVYADETPVGFVMLSDDPDKPEYFLWRFLIGASFQRMGFGRRALAAVTDYVRTRPGATEFLTSVVQADGGPQGFYEAQGFALTGEFEDGEAVLRMVL